MGGKGAPLKRRLLRRFGIACLDKFSLKRGFSRANREIAYLAIGRKKIRTADTEITPRILSFPHIGGPIFRIFQIPWGIPIFPIFEKAFLETIPEVSGRHSQKSVGDTPRSLWETLQEVSGRHYQKSLGDTIRSLWESSRVGSLGKPRKSLKIL